MGNVFGYMIWIFRKYTFICIIVYNHLLFTAGREASFVFVSYNSHTSHPIHFLNFIYPSSLQHSFHHFTFSGVPFQHFYYPPLVHSSRCVTRPLPYQSIHSYLLTHLPCSITSITHPCIQLNNSLSALDFE